MAIVKMISLHKIKVTWSWSSWYCHIQHVSNGFIGLLLGELKLLASPDECGIAPVWSGQKNELIQQNIKYSSMWQMHAESKLPLYS